MNLDIAKKLLIQEIYTEEPVSVDEFFTNPYYMGDIFTNIYPYWKQFLREMYPDPLSLKSSYVAFTGAIGIGKTTASEGMIYYDIYRISKLKSTTKFFDTMSSRGYFVKCFNITKDKAYPLVNEMNHVVFDGIVPYFRDAIAKGNRFLNNLHFSACAKIKDIISDDVIGFILSELNDVKRKPVAEEIMKASEDRLWSRFRRGQDIFCHYILDSSARGEDSVVDDFIYNNPNAKDAVIVQCAHWDVKTREYDLIGPRFDFYLGDSIYSPFILKSHRDIELLKLDRDRVIQVPEECRKQITGSTAKTIYSFIQDVCGRSTQSSYKFFSDAGLVRDQMKLELESKDVLVLDFFDKDDTLYAKLEQDVLKLPKDRKLFIGIDCGISHDLFGLSIGYAAGMTRYNENDGGNLDYLNIRIPISIGLSRKEGQETAINKVHDFIIRLAQDYDIGCVVSDQYQSFSIKQILLQNGINSVMRSIDRDDSAYVTFKRWIYMGLIELCNSKLLEQELLGLVINQSGNRFKVEKPRDGISHGDVAASVVQLVDLMLDLGPNEVLAESKFNLRKLTDLYDNLSQSKLRPVKPMMNSF